MRLFRLAPLLLLLSASTSQAQSQENSAQGQPPALVVTAKVEKERVRSSLTLTGTANPSRISAVAAEGEGRVETMAAREGDRVAKGDVLVTLRTLPLKLELAEARAALSEIEARLAKASGDRGRARALYSKGFISEEELESRQTEEKTLARQAERAQATLRRLEDRLQRMAVRAPFAGRVVEERTEVGQWVQESDPVVLLADLSAVKIRVPVPEKHIAELDRESSAEVRFEALPEEKFSGHVSAVIPQADTAARTFPVEVTVPNPDSRILAGMLTRVTFEVGQPRPALLVTKDALVPQPEGGGYLVKVEQGVAQIVPVKVLGSHGERYAVESLGPPLSPGDEIVVRGNERLRPGQRITTSAAPAGEKAR